MMNNDDDIDGQEEENPEEMVNRRLAEALEDQQRYMSMFQTSANMIQMLSRFMADPVVVHDLEIVSDHGTDSPSSPSSPTPTSSCSSLVNTSTIEHHNNGPEPVISCQLVETTSNTLTLRGRRPQSCRTRQDDSPSAQRAVRFQIEGGTVEEVKNGHTGPHEDPLSAGDGQHFHTNTEASESANSENYFTQILNRRLNETFAPSQDTNQRQTHDITTNTGSLTPSGTDVELQQQHSLENRVDVGVGTQTSIDNAMTEIAKAADTIRRARAMINSFSGPNAQSNNNHRDMIQSNEISQQSNSAFDQTHAGNAANIANPRKSSDELEVKNTPRQIIVKPARETETISNENKNDAAEASCSFTLSERNSTTTKCAVKKPGRKILSAKQTDWTEDKLVVRIESDVGQERANQNQHASITPHLGNSSRGIGTRWSRHFQDTVPHGIESSNAWNQNFYLVVKEDAKDPPLPMFESKTRQASEELEVKSTPGPIIVKPVRETETISNGSSKHDLNVTLEVLQNALKIAFQNIHKERVNTGRNKDSEFCSQSKVDANRFMLPVLDLPPLGKDLASPYVYQQSNSHDCNMRTTVTANDKPGLNNVPPVNVCEQAAMKAYYDSKHNSGEALVETESQCEDTLLKSTATLVRPFEISNAHVEEDEEQEEAKTVPVTQGQGSSPRCVRNGQSCDETRLGKLSSGGQWDTLTGDTNLKVDGQSSDRGKNSNMVETKKEKIGFFRRVSKAVRGWFKK